MLWLCIGNGFYIAREIDRINFWSYVRHLKAYDLMTIHTSILWDDHPPFQSFLYFLYEKCSFEKGSKWETNDFLRKLSSYHHERLNPSKKHSFMIQDIDRIFVHIGEDPFSGINEFMDNFLRTRFNVYYGPKVIDGMSEKGKEGQLALTC